MLDNFFQRLYEHSSLQFEKQSEIHTFTRQIDSLFSHELSTSSILSARQFLSEFARAFSLQFEIFDDVTIVHDNRYSLNENSKTRKKRCTDENRKICVEFAKIKF